MDFVVFKGEVVGNIVLGEQMVPISGQVFLNDSLFNSCGGCPGDNPIITSSCIEQDIDGNEDSDYEECKSEKRNGNGVFKNESCEQMSDIDGPWDENAHRAYQHKEEGDDKSDEGVEKVAHNGSQWSLEFVAIFLFNICITLHRWHGKSGIRQEVGL